MSNSFDFDYIIIGSGFGGSVSALRLAEKGYRVCLLERGKRYRTEDFPESNWNLRKYLWLPKLHFFGYQELTLFKNILILSGTGVGGGSLVYANALLEPGESFFSAPSWKDLANWKSELLPFYQKAKKMLGATKNPFLSEVDQELIGIAREMGKESTVKSVDVGVLFGPPEQEGKTIPDPFFGGRGPDRAICELCGGCMVGCRHNAKNTLDKNYLFFAEKLGAEIRPESLVRKIRPLDSGGYEVEVVKTTAWFSKKPYTLTAKGIVLSAGVLGSTNLLLKCRDIYKTLPKISNRLGSEVRTNSEALVGVMTRDRHRDFSKGIAIGVRFCPDSETHIEGCRYPRKSSFMRLLAIPMVDDGNRFTRPLKFLWVCLTRPWHFIRIIFNFRWAESMVILLVMQSIDNKMSLVLRRGLLSFFCRRMSSEPDHSLKIPSYIPVGHRVARQLARRVNGIPQSMFNEVLFQIPSTAHILGGCVIGATPEQGVIDTRHELFGYRNFYICDGSVVPANPGVNPSLTITAMTERCMAGITNKPVDSRD